MLRLSFPVHGDDDVVSAVLCGILHERAGTDYTDRTGDAGFHGGYAGVRSAERYSADISRVGAGENFALHCGAQKDRAAHTAGNHSSPFYGRDGSLLVGAGFGYYLSSYGDGAFPDQYQEDSVGGGASEDTVGD